MQAIQTFYKGYHFRSRLEARWAVFFDALGWQWEYEKEGFQLSDGTNYLPDFYLPQIKTWVEIKAEKFTAAECEKCRLLSQGLGHDYYVMMASGLPEEKGYEAFCNGGIDYITLTQYIRSKGWDIPYLSTHWDEADRPAFDLARSARFEYGQSGAAL